MGEAKRRQSALQTQAAQAMAVDTPGGRIHVQWDHEARTTPNAQLAFFAEFLCATGVYETWVKSCPLAYTSPNAPTKQDVLGTWLLAILAGHNRYAHITALRADAVSPQILGMNKIISEDALRRALARLSAEQSRDWLAPQLMGSVQAALNTPWILDIDITIKPLYGKQAGAQVSYNPHKPGRPSHALHTYWVANLRLVLDVVVSPGKEHSPGLVNILDKLLQPQRPALVRGAAALATTPSSSSWKAAASPTCSSSNRAWVSRSCSHANSVSVPPTHLAPPDNTAAIAGARWVGGTLTLNSQGYSCPASPSLPLVTTLSQKPILRRRRRLPLFWICCHTGRSSFTFAGVAKAAGFRWVISSSAWVMRITPAIPR
jgi:hypothetical protein